MFKNLIILKQTLLYNLPNLSLANNILMLEVIGCTKIQLKVSLCQIEQGLNKLVRF